MTFPTDVEILRRLYRRQAERLREGDADAIEETAEQMDRIADGEDAETVMLGTASGKFKTRNMLVCAEVCNRVFRRGSGKMKRYKAEKEVAEKYDLSMSNVGIIITRMFPGGLPDADWSAAQAIEHIKRNRPI